MTILPLHSADPELLLGNGEPVDLGFGVSVESCQQFLESADVWIWNHKGIQDDQEELKSWRTCLVHRYKAEPVTGENDENSITLLAYVLAHLRLINPHRDSADDTIQLQQKVDGETYSAFRCTKAAFRPNRFLIDCENLISGISRVHLNQLKKLMPWIVDFAPHWKTYYPLWLSMYFIEEAYKPGHNFRTLHLFRVMALEALFCSESSFGKKALTRRIPKLLGIGIDLYELYKVDFFQLPTMPLRIELIKDIYTVRNKIAHSDALPETWPHPSRTGLNGEISYLAQLAEAATAIVRLAWLKITKDGLQEIFSDKEKMQKYLN